MKFGRGLPRNQVPEWASSYIKYKALKKLIKSAVEDAKQGHGVDTAEFFYSLDRNLEDVDDFYNKKYEDAARRLKLLQDRYGKPSDSLQDLDKDEVEDLMGALLELRGQLRKLQWYGEVNRRGFIKITKKFDKKIAQVASQRPYLDLKVDPKQFATNSNLSETVKFVNDWLSTLGEFRPAETKDAIDPSRPIHRVAANAMPNFPKEWVDSLNRAISDDDAQTLTGLLKAHGSRDVSLSIPGTTLALNVLQKAISCRSKACISTLFGYIDNLDEFDEINQRNFIHRLVITLGRSALTSDEDALTESPPMLENFLTPAKPPALVALASRLKDSNGLSRFANEEESVSFLKHLLDSLRPHQRNVLRGKDAYGRMPLHYAAQYGLVLICQLIIARMHDWDQLKSVEAPFWQDLEGYTPLHLSVIGGHPLTTKALLVAEDMNIFDGTSTLHRHMANSGEVLALATKANFTHIVKLLIEAGVDLNYQDDQGETALHIAARFNHVACARILITGSGSQRANIELTERAFGWTPLFLSCVDGHLEMVEILVAAGANLDNFDTSGWTAKEHATLRGHANIWRALAHATPEPKIPNSLSAFDCRSPTPGISPAPDRPSNEVVNGGNRPMTPVKTFGHRYLTKESMILVTLGSTDTRKAINAVHLDRVPMSDIHSTQLDTALSLVVSAGNANGEPSITDLPVQDNLNTEPITFMAVDATKVKLFFDIVPTYAGSSNKVIGRGVALLSAVKPSIGSQRISLQGDVTVPIIAATTLDVIGTVNFNFLVITPFTHPNMTINENQTYWKSMASTMLIGHRGLGKNMAARRSLQLGENTIQSFIAAANLGASYVEFDVQLTKDLVPVIYHDFLVSETGIDAPVHTLTLEQFLHVSDSRTPRPSRPPSPAPGSRAVEAIKNGEFRRHRSMSAHESAKLEISDMSERMKHTRDFKNKGFKGNSRGNSIQAPFTTLEEMFKTLPESIGFNIEMKYPMLFESEEQGMDTYAVEVNSFVDTVLTKVYDLGKKRNIIFSSFNPDICLLLSFKQPSIPILFLTDAGVAPVGDIRASSLQEAIRFASRWNLLGVVTAAEPLVTSPRLVRVVKESGLVCVSYGQMNNDPEKVKVIAPQLRSDNDYENTDDEQIQVKEGIDAVIVDSVLAIRQGLTGSQSKPSTLV